MNSSSKDQERDSTFGRTLLTIRTRLGLTQSSMAKILDISPQTIMVWEAGTSYPSPNSLRRVIEFAVQQHAFPSGREHEEIHALWKQAHQKVLLDDLWLKHLLTASPSSPPLRADNEDSTHAPSSAPTPPASSGPESLLTTKFSLPLSSHLLVPRPRLSDVLLARSVERPFTLVSAPAGFGKTTLLASWLKSLPEGEQWIAWLSLDEEDNDPVRFWRYLLTSLERQRPGPLTNLLASLQTHQMSFLPYLVTELLNQLSDIQEPLILVLDDYYHITETGIHTALTSLLDHLPPSVHLILATRADPPVPLSRLRAQGKLLEVRTEQLRWTQEETRLFLENVMHIYLSTERVEHVRERTEGWIVGIQLLGLSLQGRAMPENLLDVLSGSQHYILDFLTDEVLHRQEASVQTFLLHTSILERLSASLCDAVMEQEGSQQMLEYLERANLFVVSLDMQRQWYRYHALFAEVLRYRLAQEGDGMVATLHRRASLWYERQGQMNEAVMHALQAHDWHRAADLIETMARVEIGSWKNEVSLRRWIMQLPKEVTRARPLLSLTYALSLFRNASPESIEDWLQVAEEGITAQLSQLTFECGEAERTRQHELNDMLGTVFVIQAFNTAYRGNASLAIMLNQQALNYLSEKNFSIRALLASNQGLINVALGEAGAAIQNFLEAVKYSQRMGMSNMSIAFLVTVGKILIFRGRLHEAWNLFEQSIALSRTESSFILPNVSHAYGFQADLLREWNRFDAADDLMSRAVQMGEQAQDLIALEAIYAIRASIDSTKEDSDLAISSFEQAEQVSMQLKSPFAYVLQILPKQVRFLIAQGKIAHAAQLVEELLQQDQQQVTSLIVERIKVARVRVLLAQQEPEEVLGILPALLQGAIRQERYGHAIEMYLLHALASQRVQQEQEALASLREALRLAEPEGYIRLFVDEGPQMAALLTTLLTQERHHGATHYLETLLGVFSQEQARAHPTTPLAVQQRGLLDPLTERELEILRKMAQGTTNQQIAENLVIAITTVKRHITHIFEKLGVGNRTQAVARARRLGLLSDQS